MIARLLAVAQIRLVGVVAALVMVLLANRFYVLDRLSVGDTDSPLPWLGTFWPWWYLAAGAACGGLALRPSSARLVALSGAMVVAGFTWRAVAVVLAFAEGSAELQSVQLHIAGIVYTIVAALSAYLWVREIRPASYLLRSARHIAPPVEG